MSQYAAPGDFDSYKEFFREKELTEGIKSTMPHQYQITSDKFGGQFSMLYQVCREDRRGEIYSFRVFYRDVNGAKIANWLNQLHQYYVQKHVVPVGKKEPVEVLFSKSAHVRNQLDFLVLQIPGKYAEMLIDTYFKELKAHL